MVGKRNLIFLCLVTTESRNTILRGSVYRHVSGLYQPHTGGGWWSSGQTFISYKTELCIFQNFFIVFLTGSYLDLSLFPSVEPCKSLRVINGFAGENKFFTRALWIGGTRLDKPLQL